MCACVGAVSAMAEQADSTKVNKESHSLNLYGFARAEMYVNSRENYEAKGGIISLYPKPIELDDYGFDKNAKVNAAYANYIETKLLEDYRVGNIRGVLRVSYNFSHTWKFANK